MNYDNVYLGRQRGEGILTQVMRSTNICMVPAILIRTHWSGDAIVSLQLGTHTGHVTYTTRDVEITGHDIWCHLILSGTLHGLGLSIGHFSHVFVDEAGQATEPECLVPISLLAGTHGQVRQRVTSFPGSCMRTWE